MAQLHARTDLTCCPFIDLNDPRCAKHFSLGRMDEAFDLCLNQYHRCATHYQIQAQQRAVIRLTLFGQPCRTDDGLRKTGS